MTKPSVCKFQVTKVIPSLDQTPGTQSEVVTLEARYLTEVDPPTEDENFSKFTPWGKLEFSVTNPNLLGNYVVGDSFYIRLEPIPKPQDEVPTPG